MSGDTLFTPISNLNFKIDKQTTMVMDEELRDFLLREIKQSGVDINNIRNIEKVVSKSIFNLDSLILEAKMDIYSIKRATAEIGKIRISPELFHFDLPKGEAVYCSGLDERYTAEFKLKKINITVSKPADMSKVQHAIKEYQLFGRIKEAVLSQARRGIKNGGGTVQFMVSTLTDEEIAKLPQRTKESLVAKANEIRKRFIASRMSCKPKLETIFKNFFKGQKLEIALQKLKKFNYKEILEILYELSDRLYNCNRNRTLLRRVCKYLQNIIKVGLKPPKTGNPSGKPGGAATKEPWYKRFFGKKAQPPKGTVVIEAGEAVPKGGKLLGFIGGVATGAALFVLDYPGIGHAARISDDIYYGLKPTLLSNYRGDVHQFASAFEFYIKKDILTDKFREKYSLLDFADEYTALAFAKEKHNLSGPELKEICRIYLGVKKTLGSLKFSLEELINARKWYNGLKDNEFKQKYSFERLLVKYIRSKTNFHNAEYIQKMGIDLESGGGDLVLREVMKRMYSNIALNELKRPILKAKKLD